MGDTEKLLEDGTLNPKWLDSLTGSELREWVYDVLHGRELDVPGSRQELAFSLLLDAHEQTDTYGKRALAQAVADHVEEMADDADSEWRGPAGDELLLVASEVCGKDILPSVHLMLEKRELLGSEPGVPGDIHLRLLQTLVALDVPMDSEFWKEHLSIAPQQYLGIAFRGLALLSPGAAIELLNHAPVDWTPELIANIERALDGLSEQVGTAQIGQLVARHIWRPQLASLLQPYRHGDTSSKHAWTTGPAASRSGVAFASPPG